MSTIFFYQVVRCWHPLKRMQSTDMDKLSLCVWLKDWLIIGVRSVKDNAFNDTQSTDWLNSFCIGYIIALLAWHLEFFCKSLLLMCDLQYHFYFLLSRFVLLPQLRPVNSSLVCPVRMPASSSTRFCCPLSAWTGITWQRVCVSITSRLGKRSQAKRESS